MWAATIWLGYDANGKRRRRTIYGGTKKGVQQELRKLQLNADACQIPEATRLTMSQFLASWLDSVKTTVAPMT